VDTVLRPRVLRQVHALPRGHLLADPDLRTARTGRGTEEDLDKLLDISDTIFGKSFCALATARPPRSQSSSVPRRVRGAFWVSCPFDLYASMLAAPEGVGA
jgi:hypothetical protein